MGTIRLHPRPKYLALILTAVQRAIAYRGTTLLNIVANAVWVAVLFYLWRSVFAARAQIGDYSWSDMRTYILVAYAISTLLSFYSLAGMMNMIRTGDVATELLRPIDYMTMQLAQIFGAALVEGCLSGALAMLAGVFLLDIAPPQGALAACLFFMSVWLGFLVKFLISFLVSLLCFRTTNGVGLIWMQTAVLNLLSGALIPLTFFPDWLRVFAQGLPFGSIVYTPVAIYLGKLEGGALWQALGFQIMWVAALWVLARVLWSPSVRALEIQGG